MIKRIFKLIGILILIFLVSSLAGVVYYKMAPVEVTPLMLIRSVSPKGTPAQAEQEKHWEHRWVPYSEISPLMERAVRSSEDGRFYSHNGFDTIEIRHAMEEAERGGKLRGASTVSQQTAKNVFLWPGGGWFRKGLEAWFTVLIETVWGKERIMEVYLNSIEMGPGIYGVQAAAEHFFHTDAEHLTAEQCALIVAALPNPIERNVGNPSPYLKRRAARIRKYMKQQAPPPSTY